MPAAVVYLRMSAALGDALRTRAEIFLRDVRAGGSPATVTDERRELIRPERMKPIVDRS